ncbi:hypothetical protein M0R72_00850 [Candidatus Pacearchaeota archaeon]|jgi:hypothetical protein|nr:hypothetical protein [Candidatus Pacearchaeota archaeon]
MNLDIRTLPTIDAGITEFRKEDREVMFVSYSPQNGTLYNLIFTDIKGSDEVGEQGGWLVTWINSHDLKAMVVTDNGGFLAWQYVMEKMRASISDAVCLAEIIGHCTGREYDTCEEVARQAEE